MLKTIMKRRQVGWIEEVREREATTPQRDVSIWKLLGDAVRPARGCIDGMIRMLRIPWQNSSTDMALKGLIG